MALKSYLKDEIREIAEASYLALATISRTEQVTMAQLTLLEAISAQASQKASDSTSAELLCTLRLSLKHGLQAIQAESSALFAHANSAAGWLWTALVRQQHDTLGIGTSALPEFLSSARPTKWRTDDLKRQLFLDTDTPLTLRLWPDQAAPKRWGLRQPSDYVSLRWNPATRHFIAHHEECLSWTTLLQAPSTQFFLSASVNRVMPSGQAVAACEQFALF